MLPVILTTPAQAAPETCMDLLHRCQAQKRISDNNFHPTDYNDLTARGYCLGYFEGFVNGVTGINDASLFCLPDTATTGQTTLVFVAWAERHPEKPHLAAGICAAAALSEAFPCPKAH